MYGKHFASMYTGSMFGAGPVVFAVWGYAIGNAVNEQVELNPTMLAAMIGTDVPAVERAIDTLMSPDPASRSKADDGRRLVREGQFAYRVVNHKKYRDMRHEDDRREYNRQAKAEQRKRDKAKAGKSTDVNTPVNDSQAMSAHTEAEAEAEAETNAVGCTETPDTFPQTFPQTPPADPAAPIDVDFAIADDVTEGLTVAERALRLTVALNQGHADNPLLGEAYNPALPYSTHAINAVEDIAREGVSLKFALAHAYQAGKTYRPEKPGQAIGSIAFVAKTVVKPWQQHRARIDAAGSSRPAPASNGVQATPGHPQPSGGIVLHGAANGNGAGRRDLKGEGLLWFGRLRDAVRESIVWDRPDDPDDRGGNRLDKAIRPDVLAAMPAPGHAALAAIGGPRKITHAAIVDESIGWKFAAAYAASAGGAS